MQTHQRKIVDALVDLRRYKSPANGKPFSEEGMAQFADDLERTAKECNSSAHEMAGVVIKRLLSEKRELRAALAFLKAYADETRGLWDADQDHKVGKRLMAMAGDMPSYDARITMIHELTKEPT